MKNFNDLINQIEKVEFINLDASDFNKLRYGRNNINIDLKTYKQLYKIAYNFFEANSLISLQEYFIQIFDCWCAFNLNKANLTDVKNKFKNLYISKPKYFTNLRSIYGVKLDNINKFEFADTIVFSKEYLPEYLKSQPENKLNKLYPYNKNFSDTLIATKVKSITQQRANEIIESKYKEIENFFNFFIRRNTQPIFILKPNYSEHVDFSITFDEKSATLNYKLGGSPYDPITLDSSKFSNNQIHEIFDIFSLKKDNKKDIIWSLFNAINWIGKANTETDNAVAFTEYTFALECLLGNFTQSDIITPSISYQISNNAAFLLIDTGKENYIENRKQIMRKIKTLYGLRSGIVHGGKTSIELQEVNSIKEILIELVFKILTLYKEKRIITYEALSDYINDLMYK